MGLENVEWEACLLEPLRDRELEAFLRREIGGLPPGAPYLAPAPWVVRSLAAIESYRVGLAHVDFALADLIGLVVSQDNSCRYCYATQRLLMRIQGFPEKRIRELEQDLLEPAIEPRTKLALDFARRVSRGSPLACAADADPLREAGYADGAIKEISFLAAANVYLNRLFTLPAIPPQRLERMSTAASMSCSRAPSRWRSTRASRCGRCRRAS